MTVCEFDSPEDVGHEGGILLGGGGLVTSGSGAHGQRPKRGEEGRDAED